MTASHFAGVVGEILGGGGTPIEVAGARLSLSTDLGRTFVTIQDEPDTQPPASALRAVVTTPLEAAVLGSALLRSDGASVDYRLVSAVNDLTGLSAVVHERASGAVTLSTHLGWQRHVPERPIAALVATCALLQAPTFAQALQAALGLPAQPLEIADRDMPLEGLGEDFSKTEADLASVNVLAFGDTDGLTAELPWERGAQAAALGHRTSLLEMSGTTSHPLLGRGLAFRIKMHAILAPDTAPVLAGALNELDLRGDLPPCPGAWTGRDDGQLLYTGFVPTFAYSPGLARWIVQQLLGKHTSAAWMVRQLRE